MSDTALPTSIDDTLARLSALDYVADRQLATCVYLALKLQRPLFLEGEPGTGKTEIARTLATMLGRPLIRLQCYEGLDLAGAAYEWNYGRQMMEIRLAEATGGGAKESRDALANELFSERFLTKRALLQAIDPANPVPPVLLIDELDRADEPFEAFLLEVLADYQITIPELGTVKAAQPLHKGDDLPRQGRPGAGHAAVQDVQLAPGVGEADPVVQTAALDRVVDLARAVAGEHHDGW